MPRPRFPALALLALVGLVALTGCGSARTITLERQPEAVRASTTLSEVPLRQTLVVPPGGLDEIELVLAPPTEPVEGSRPLTWKVSDRGQLTLREGAVETGPLDANSPLSLRFESLDPGLPIELQLSAPPDSEIAFWVSGADRYAEGQLFNNGLDNSVDLLFTLRASEGPRDALARLGTLAREWRPVAPWLPLLLLGPGWLLLWLLPPGGRPPFALIAGLSVALAPLVYLWSSLIGLRLYEPLAQSLFQATALLLLLLWLRRPGRARAHLALARDGALLVMGLATALSIASWLLAARELIAPPGLPALESALLAQVLVREGLIERLSAPLPPAALGATLAQLSRDQLSRTMLMGGLTLGISLVPALYALGAELIRSRWLALWLLPLAWLWPDTWAALADGELGALYATALLPVALVLGLRALSVEERPLRTIALAALPLAALLLIKGIAALGLVAITLLLLRPAAVWIPPLPELVIRLALWLLAALLLIVPGWVVGNPLAASLPPISGYPLLLAALGIALLLASLERVLARRDALPAGLLPIAGAIALLLLLPLAWWRTAPLPLDSVPLTRSDLAAQRWAETGTSHGALFLLNGRLDGTDFVPADGGIWLPLHAGRATTLQRPLDPPLLERALAPGGLDQAGVRRALRLAGVTHIYIGPGEGALTPAAIQGQPWSRLVFQSGAAHIFELLEPLEGET